MLTQLIPPIFINQSDSKVETLQRQAVSQSYAIDGPGGTGKSTALLFAIRMLTENLGFSPRYPANFCRVIEPLDHIVSPINPQDLKATVLRTDQDINTNIIKVPKFRRQDIHMPWIERTVRGVGQLTRTRNLSIPFDQWKRIQAKTLMVGRVRFQQNVVDQLPNWTWLRDRSVISTLAYQCDPFNPFDQITEFVLSYYNGPRAYLKPFNRTFIMIPRPDVDIVQLLDNRGDTADAWDNTTTQEQVYFLQSLPGRYVHITRQPIMKHISKHAPMLIYPDFNAGPNKASFVSLAIAAITLKDIYQLKTIPHEHNSTKGQLLFVHPYLSVARENVFLNPFAYIIDTTQHLIHKSLGHQDNEAIIFPEELDFGDFKFCLHPQNQSGYLFLWVPDRSYP